MNKNYFDRYGLWILVLVFLAVVFISWLVYRYQVQALMKHT
ncbi:hypothetical protein [Terrimonas ferruginea]|jgi:hypothetical protein|nr:hypothetical protein [Terrimonas ferruginea]